MTLDVTTNLLDIDVDYVDNIDPTELENFKADLKDIECRTSVVYTWKASNTRPQARPQQTPNSSPTDTDVQDRKNHRLQQAKETAKASHTNIQADYCILKEEVMEHGNYLTAENHIITEGMKLRKPWKTQVTKITKDLVNLKALINTHTMSDIDVSTSRTCNS